MVADYIECCANRGQPYWYLAVDMKTEKEFYENSWSDMSNSSRHREISWDILGWLRQLKARKLKDVMDRSRAYWARKRQRRRVVRMLRLQRKFEQAMREVKENANV